MNTLVSVIIPAYNAQNFIKECLDSTLHQSYDNIEVIIVNDGSTDDTDSICREYMKQDSRIKYFCQENKGVSASRNLGLQNATGKYVVFFDADDYPESELIVKYLNAAYEWKKRQISLILCGISDDNLYNARVGTKELLLEKKHGYLREEYYLLGRHAVSTLCWLKLFNFVTNKFYELEIIKSNQIQFDEDVHIAEDLKFNLDYLDVTSGPIGVVNSIGYHYVKRTANSLSVSCNDTGLEDTKKIYSRLIEWEKQQTDVSEDDILVLKSIYIADWTSRLTSIWDANKASPNRMRIRRMLNNEINSKEFQSLLKEIHKAQKISGLRYHALRLGSLDLFCLLRAIYQAIKG